MKESKKRALISVSDKTGAIDFAKGLSALGYEIISTGGTAAALSAAGVKNTGISDITGFPECLDGRVKTLHPAVHAGLLALRDDKSHMEQLEKLNLGTIDVVAVNLYPFKSTIEKPGVSLKEAVENIDIGGPTMLRSAAKNYRFVISAVDPADYPEILSRLKSGMDDEEFRLQLMYKVFQHTAVYDTLISGYLREQAGIGLPDQITFAYEKAQELRYGENPHQSAAFYRECFKYPGALTAARQLHGKELSYNNINDANGALDLLREFNEPCAVAVKHANPCGCAVAEDITAAYIKAYESDPVSIFGGIVALNREVNEALAKELYKTFLEIIIAPAFTTEALMILTKKQNIRLLELPTINAPLKKGTLDMKKVVGGLLVQGCDNKVFEGELKCVTARAPTPEELKEMEFAWRVVKHCKSNAIALSKNGATVGIGVGQTNRVWATQQAIEHAGENAKGTCMASDAFFPFNDCAEAAAKAGVTCIIQPGGSVRDADSIEMCNRHGIAMVFCGMRHFKH